MATSLFTGQTPAVPDANDGTDYTLGTAMRRSTSGQIVRGRWYCPTTPPTGTPDFVLYSSAGVELHREPWPGLLGGQWNETPDFDVPVDYTANDLVVASVYTSGQYCATVDPAFWNAADLVNGDITAPGAQNGRLSNVDSYPSNIVDLCFFVDLVFADDAPAELAEGEATLGIALTVATAGARGSAGVAAAGVGLAVSASGARDSSGFAAAGLQLQVAAAGGRESSGIAAAGLVLTVAASGARAAQGTVALGLALTAAAFGPGGGPAPRGPVVVTTSAGPSATVHTRTTTARLEVSAR